MSINTRMDKRDVVYVYSGILVIKKNEITIASNTELEIILSELNQKEKDKSIMISLICGI